MHGAQTAAQRSGLPGGAPSTARHVEGLGDKIEEMTTTALPELWTDWCSVTGVPEQEVDKPALDRFSRQAGPSKSLDVWGAALGRGRCSVKEHVA
ncbi:hypothetical protein [Rhodococcus erythropolis]|uniref:hypothetical protein n=1 Tax=Rhodococcus erythropolis TaxID=1833 RepID=UPI000878AC95|nr:hypothetical protein [Rhodococcus erythropolis]OFV73516.1 hypothetical protein RERY_58420 [Rhodococcus erythropolis]